MARIDEVQSTMPIVDAHHHFWDPTRNYHPWLCDEPMIPFRYGDYSAIRKPYLPAGYLRDAARHRVVKTVYVETEWDPADPLGETAYIHAVAAEHGLPNAVVAHARLDAPSAGELIAAQARYPLVRGIRDKPKAAVSPAESVRGQDGSMDDPRWRDGFAQLAVNGLSFDLQTPWWHLDAAFDLARDFPSIPIIVNHAGLPADRSKAGLSGWHRAMAALAEAPNISVKISGLGRPGVPWTVADNEPIVRSLIALYGVDRCMFASNFPVDSVCASFDTIYSGFEACVQDRSEADRRLLFHDNAVRIYRPA